MSTVSLARGTIPITMHNGQSLVTKWNKFVQCCGDVTHMTRNVNGELSSRCSPHYITTTATVTYPPAWTYDAQGKP